MLPWGHAAVGYLCYSVWLRIRDRGRPPGPAVIALAIGTQLPDLIDKPLAWSLGMIPSGRSLAHSLLFVAVLALVVWLLADRYDGWEAATAFLLGYFTHIVADVVPAAMAGEWAKLGSLLWPLTPAYRYPGEMDRNILGFFLDLDAGILLTVEGGLTVLAIVLWVADGRPGLATLRDWLRIIVNSPGDS